MKRKARRISGIKAVSASQAALPKLYAERGLGRQVPPAYEFILIYFDQQGMAAAAPEFFSQYQKARWKNTSGVSITNWKTCASEWIYERRQAMIQRLRRSPFYSGGF